MNRNNHFWDFSVICLIIYHTRGLEESGWRYIEFLPYGIKETVMQ